MKRCDQCVHFVPGEYEDLHDCRRYPPLTDGFPNPRRNQWCGEFNQAARIDIDLREQLVKGKK